MSQVNSVKDLRNKHAKCLVQNRGQTTFIDIKSSSLSRPKTINKLLGKKMSELLLTYLLLY